MLRAPVSKAIKFSRLISGKVLGVKHESDYYESIFRRKTQRGDYY